MKYVFKYIIISFSVFIFSACSNDENKDVLIHVAGKVITLSEFLNRAELTPRPFYCRSDSDRDKIIILNTLIAEKLFAIEERPESALVDKPLFKAYIQGRKEQYMREELFNSMAVSENELDSSEISDAFKLAGLVYDVKFYMLDTERAMTFQNDMQAIPGLKDSLFNALSLSEKAPRNRVQFDDPEYPSLHHILFGKQWNTGDIVGPVRLRETQYMVLKIDKVNYNPAITQTEISNRRKRVKERLIEKKTNQRRNQFTANLMKGKKIQFKPDITTKVAGLWAQNFIKNDRVIRVTEDSDKYYGQFMPEIELLSDMPMFIVNDDIWTVADFRNILLSHPLVFRKADLAPSEFLQQFRFAVADLIQDFFITKEAYAQNIDNLKAIQRKVAMWEDSYLALEHRNKYLAAQHDTTDEGKKNRNFHTLIDPYLKSLKNKYKNQLEINVALLKKIKLTHTDFITAQQFVPYQQLVPAFPFLTRDDQLEFETLQN